MMEILIAGLIVGVGYSLYSTYTGSPTGEGGWNMITKSVSGSTLILALGAVVGSMLITVWTLMWVLQ